MKQVFFDGKGQLLIEEVPAPTAPENGALVRVAASLISSGTEMSQTVGGGSLLRKALEQPELIGRAIQLALREGLRFTARAVQDVSESWFPAGYSSAGMVVDPGSDGLHIGERVACTGAGFATHAEFNAVPHNLLAAIPEGVTYQQAAFTTVGAIALQGVRRAEVTLGETVVVVGLGLIGQITAQILDAAGCRVVGSDPIETRRDLAAKLAGARVAHPDQVLEAVMDLTGGSGADRVILAASTKSSEPTNQAFKMCRERGRVVMVGAMGMDLDRVDFYNKELDFVISRSAGPGRYDRAYEERGVDYPIGYVRWTEQRNMAAFLNLLAAGKLDLDSLVTAAYPIEQAADAYQAVAEGALGVLLTYGQPEDAPRPDTVLIRAKEPAAGRIGLGVVGAGMFARQMHLPNIKASRAFELRGVVSGGGSAAQVAQKYDLPLAATDLDALLLEPSIDAVLIATRHHLHAEQARAALSAGKHVFVEKPMALSVAACEDLIDVAFHAQKLLTVGFNRRAAPTARTLKAALESQGGPYTMIYRVNAGAIPAGHWLNDPEEGGGRLLGEGVHFIDFICGMVGADPVTVSAQGTADGQEFTLVMRFADGSIGTVIYTARGDTSIAKERVEVFASGGTAVLDDFKTLTFHGMRGSDVRSRGQDKGHRALLENFGAAIRGDEVLIVTARDGLRATKAALAAAESMRSHRAVLYAD